MNQLALMFYLADVVGGLSVILALLTLATGGPLVIASGMGLMSREENRRYGSEDKDFQRGDALCKWAIPKLWVPLVFAMLLVLTPSQQTIYAIAATQVGEKVLNTETGGKAVKALNAWLDRQITGGK